MYRLTAAALLVLALSACGHSASTEPSLVTTPSSVNEAKAIEARPNDTSDAARRAALPNYDAADLQTDRAIDFTLGNHVPYKKALTDFQKAVAAHDSDSVAAMIRYPLTVDIGKDKVVIPSPSIFKQYYAKLITPATAKVIADTHYPTVMFSGKGIEVGDGNVWFDGDCKDTACKNIDVKVATLQPKSTDKTSN